MFINKNNPVNLLVIVKNKIFCNLLFVLQYVMKPIEEGSQITLHSNRSFSF